MYNLLIVIQIDKTSLFWKYLSPSQKGLMNLGMRLIQEREKYPDAAITDYSYMVFPFAKAYEGFLKQYFRDMGFITEEEYTSNHFRIGRALNPHLEKYLRSESVYDKIRYKFDDREIADEFWDIWRRGRNLVFHYFPHNLRALSEKESLKIISDIINIMQKAVASCEKEIRTLDSYQPS